MIVALSRRWLFTLLTVLLTRSCVPEEPTITVVGHAEGRVVPNQVTINIGVVCEAKTVVEAAEANDEKLRDIIEFLKRSGIEEKHYRTYFFSIDQIQPRQSAKISRGGYGSKENQHFQTDPFGLGEMVQIPIEPIGFHVNRRMSIMVVDLKKFEEIYKGLIERGITQVHGIDYQSSEMRKQRDAVRLEAVRNAREKAQAMSAELGVKLASVRTIKESGAARGYGETSDDLFGSPFGEDRHPDSSFAAGQLTISASVEVVFRLGDEHPKQ
jgi:hypothetical protein